MNISTSNAAYRVSSLIKKGYLKKIQSREDLRTYFLEPTTKYLKYNRINEAYIKVIADRIKTRLSPEEFEKFTETLDMIDKELMNDVKFTGLEKKKNAK